MSEERDERAREYRQAAEAYLGGPKVEAAGVFQRPGWLTDRDNEAEARLIEGLFRALEWLEERLTMGRVGRLRGKFLLAVTGDKVHAFEYGGEGQDLQLRDEIAVFDRGEVRIRSIAGGEVLYLTATEKGRTHQIDLDGEAVEENPGAAEVLSALSE